MAKALAHTMGGFSKTDASSQLLEIAFRGVPALMVVYFYKRLSIEPPDYEVKKVPRKSAEYF